MDQKVKKLIKKYLKRGWFLYRIGKHHIYKHKDGGCVTISSSASNQNAIRCIERDFKTEERRMNESRKENLHQRDD